MSAFFLFFNNLLNGKILGGGNDIIIDHVFAETTTVQPLTPVKVFTTKWNRKTRPYTTTYSEFLKFAQSNLC